MMFGLCIVKYLSISMEMTFNNGLRQGEDCESDQSEDLGLNFIYKRNVNV